MARIYQKRGKPLFLSPDWRAFLRTQPMDAAKACGKAQDEGRLEGLSLRAGMIVRRNSP